MSLRLLCMSIVRPRPAATTAVVSAVRRPIAYRPSFVRRATGLSATPTTALVCVAVPGGAGLGAWGLGAFGGGGGGAAGGAAGAAGAGGAGAAAGAAAVPIPLAPSSWVFLTAVLVLLFIRWRASRREARE